MVQRQAFAGMLWSKQFYHYDSRPLAQGRSGRSRSRRANGYTAGIATGRISTTPTSFPCRTSGSIPGMPPGISPFIASRSRSSIPSSPRNSSCSCCANGTCIRTGRSRPTNGPSAMSIRRCMPGPPGAFTRSRRNDSGVGDRVFLERVFHKLLLEFYLVGESQGRRREEIFQGGFLGLDNIGVFDRSAPLPTGGHIEQSDGTSWMGMYCLNMLAIALELARENPGLRRCRQQILRAFRLHLPGHEQHRRREDRAVGRGGRLLTTTCCTCRTASHFP